MKPPLLECRNVSKLFNRNYEIRSVLSNVNLSVIEGEVMLIKGRSGAGKSVLLSLLAGLDKPTSGEIYFENYMLNSLSPKKLSKLRSEKIGVIFQNYNLISYWTALENVEAVFASPQISAKESRWIGENILTKFGLINSLHNYPCELSMGEQQRVAVARTLVKKPKLIIADEPTGEVDNETGEMIIDLMLKDFFDKRTAFVIATLGHFPQNRVDRVLELKERTIDEVKNYCCINN